jgi:hypothetical protein
MKNYTDEIGQRCKELLLEQPSLDLLTAFNFAVNECIAGIKSDSPEEWTRLEKLVKELRLAGDIDFTDLSADALQRYEQVTATLHVGLLSQGVFQTPWIVSNYTTQSHY